MALQDAVKPSLADRAPGCRGLVAQVLSASPSEELVPEPHRKNQADNGGNSSAGCHIPEPGLRQQLLCSTSTCRKAEYASVVGAPHHAYVTCTQHSWEGPGEQWHRPAFQRPSPAFHLTPSYKIPPMAGSAPCVICFGAWGKLGLERAVGERGTWEPAVSLAAQTHHSVLWSSKVGTVILLWWPHGAVHMHP